MKGSRLPTALNGAAALAMLGLIALFGFQAALAPPPTVAALQPPSHALKNAPPEQATVELPGQAKPSPSPAPGQGQEPTPAASPQAGATRQCYQLTQTPDPQSPPCRQGWDPTRQDNGGATAPGVDRETIYVTFPCLDGFFERCPDIGSLVKYFNTHFEFWGRHIELIDPWCTTWATANCNTPPPGSDAKVNDLQADASKAAHANDGHGGIFASLSYYPANGNEHYYYDTLAGQYRVASVSSVPNSQPESHYVQYDPYEWAVTPTLDLTEENLGQFLCRSMAGRAPAWAQSTNQWTPPAKRSFGIVWTQNPDGSNPVLSPVTNALQSCGAPFRVAQYDGSTASATQIVTQFMQAGVSTVGCVCGNPAWKLQFANSADNQGYHPEWLVWPFGFQDVDSMYYQNTDALCACTAAQWPRDQQSQLIGFSDFNKVLPPDEEFWFQAIREANPSYQYGDNGDDVYDYYRYEELMVLATGIQMAGPHLTPQTFAAALRDYPSRDPGHGQPPYYQALVGFTAGHGWIQDYAPVYWNQNAQNYFTNEPRTGSLCYVSYGSSGLGVRFGLNQWPDQQLDFYPGGNTPCR